MLFIRYGIYICFVVALGACSSLNELNRRPFMDKIAFLGIGKPPYAGAKSAGNEKITECRRRWFDIFGRDPTFEELRQKMIEDKIRYVVDAISWHYGEDGFLAGKSCIGIEGEVFR